MHKKKINIITYMPRKLVDHSNLLIFYIQDMLPKNWKIIPLQNISEKKLFETLSKSKIFLSFSHLEGTVYHQLKLLFQEIKSLDIQVEEILLKKTNFYQGK